MVNLYKKKVTISQFFKDIICKYFLKILINARFYNFLKNKYRNKLLVERDLKLKLTSFNPTLIDEKLCHKLDFLVIHSLQDDSVPNFPKK